MSMGLFAGALSPVCGQGLTATTPTKEFIYFEGRLVAIEERTGTTVSANKTTAPKAIKADTPVETPAPAETPTGPPVLPLPPPIVPDAPPVATLPGPTLTVDTPPATHTMQPPAAPAASSNPNE